MAGAGMQMLDVDMVDVWKGSWYLVRSFWSTGWYSESRPERSGIAARSLKPRTPWCVP